MICVSCVRSSSPKIVIILFFFFTRKLEENKILSLYRSYSMIEAILGLYNIIYQQPAAPISYYNNMIARVITCLSWFRPSNIFVYYTFNTLFFLGGFFIRFYFNIYFLPMCVFISRRKGPIFQWVNIGIIFFCVLIYPRTHYILT